MHGGRYVRNWTAWRTLVLGLNAHYGMRGYFNKLKV